MTKTPSFWGSKKRGWGGFLKSEKKRGELTSFDRKIFVMYLQEIVSMLCGPMIHASSSLVEMQLACAIAGSYLP